MIGYQKTFNLIQFQLFVTPFCGLERNISKPQQSLIFRRHSRKIFRRYFGEIFRRYSRQTFRRFSRKIFRRYFSDIIRTPLSKLSTLSNVTTFRTFFRSK